MLLLLDWVGQAVQSLTLAYLIRAVPGVLLLLGSLAGTIIILWKHRSAGGWRFSPRQILDLWAAVMITGAAVLGVLLLLGIISPG